jgi:hypothetical protein
VKNSYYATEVRVCDDLINRFQVTVSEDVPLHSYFSSGAHFDVIVRRVFMRR